MIAARGYEGRAKPPGQPHHVEAKHAVVEVHSLVEVRHVQVDVATFDEDTGPSAGGANVTGTLSQAAPALAPAWVIPAVFPDSFEIHVISTEGGPKLVAAIELVSPGNKDRPQSRRAVWSRPGFLSVPW